MLAGENAEIYKRLWYRNTKFANPDCENPVCVRYKYQQHMPDGQAAFFATHEGDKPFPHIRIAREKVPAQALVPDLDGADVGELISLAHERGHEESWRCGTYVAGTMDEEHRAWLHAEELLREHGFADWEAFEEAKRVSLAIHHQRGTR